MSTIALPPPGAAPDWTIPQDWAAYTEQEHATWDRLFACQIALLPSSVVPTFMPGLAVLRMEWPGIPDFAERNERLPGHGAARITRGSRHEHRVRAG